MHCKLLWIKMSAKNINVNYRFVSYKHADFHFTEPESFGLLVVMLLSAVWLSFWQHRFIDEQVMQC